jgi:cytochrome c peroxidase
MKTKAMDNNMKKNTMMAVMLFSSMSAIGMQAMAAENPAARKEGKAEGQQAAPSAARMPSVEEGMRLFRDPALGGPGNQKSCNSCHPAGKGLENAWKNPNLAEQVNKCIAANLKGKALPLGSVEMRSLVLYLKSLKPASSGY